eukprot:CAMPEP_0194178756 /NCGR_PEP_ID=MMETSP0154-20130528/12293_1 /TAXON_ID=1049557 /ORGANISM="Thalassiothrix antarctica, Strain L6-D1" /LENGTH=306 /DNA_ID=CAMNT_0038893817 /DNA_START=30 /DNA_END=950 /DNA_ORIENTATION=-
MYLNSFTILILLVAGFSANYRTEGKHLRRDEAGTFRVLEHTDESIIQDLEDRIDFLNYIETRSRDDADEKNFHDSKEIQSRQYYNKDELEDEEDYQVKAAALTNKIQDLKKSIQAKKDEVDIEYENRSSENKDEEFQTRINELKNLLARSKAFSQDDEEKLDIEDDEEDESNTANTLKLEDEMNNILDNEENQLKEELHGKANLLKEILSNRIDEELQDEIDRENELLSLKEMLNSVEENEESWDDKKKAAEEQWDDMSDKVKDMIDTDPKHWTTNQIVILCVSVSIVLFLLAGIMACCFYGIYKK